MDKQIHVIPEYDQLVIKVDKKEFEKLKQSIKEDGQHYPVAVNNDMVVLDGHHRFRACTELGIKIKYTIMEFPNKLLEKKFVIISNIRRRQLTDPQRLLATKALIPIEEALAAQRQIDLAGTRPNKNKDDTLGHKKPKVEDKGKAEEKAAKQVGWSRSSYRNAELINEYASEKDKKSWEEGKKKTTALAKEIKRDQKEAEYNKQRQEQLAAIPKEEIKYTIQGDFTKVETSDKIEDDSVDLIFTDPPYDKDSLYLYTALGEFASKKLKKGGSLVAYAGHFMIDDIIKNIKQSSDLEFWWIMGEFHGTEGSHTMMRKQNITVSWKPLVWFVKRGREPTNIIRQKMFADSVKSNPPENEKLGHKWEQSLTTPNYIIRNLTDEQDFVVDPMCGSGTTLVSAIKLNRRCKGIDKDKKHLDESEARISQIGGSK